MKASHDVDADAVRDFIEEVWRPRVQADGGEIRFVSFEDRTLTVRMQGECADCPIVGSRFKSFLEQAFRDAFGQPVRLRQIIDKPYFSDKEI